MAPNAPPPEIPPLDEFGFRMASLRWFLRFYQRLKPEVVIELMSRVGPHYYRLLLMGSRQAEESEKEAFHRALQGWIDDFGLPETHYLVGEAIQTILTPLPADCPPMFWWDSFREFMKWESIRQSNMPPSPEPTPEPHSFEFRSLGWTPAQESIEAAAARLRSEFEGALRQRVQEWKRVEVTDMFKLWKRDRKHVRDLRWLAIKQACPRVSLAELKSRCCKVESRRPDIATLRRGLRSAAECLELRRDQIREAPPGAPPGKRHRKRSE